jgi:hypothetical protein
MNHHSNLLRIEWWMLLLNPRQILFVAFTYLAASLPALAAEHFCIMPQTPEDPCCIGHHDKRLSEHLQVGVESIVNVCARRYWNESFLVVEKGEQYKISVDGSQRWYDACVSSGAAGQPGTKVQNLFCWLKRVRSAKWFALVICVGKSVDKPFVYCADADFVAARDGELYLFANDARLAYWNNTRHLDVHITRVR